MKILALDLGKDKSVGCVFVAETGEHSFSTIRTRPSELAQLLEQTRPDRVVIEIGPAGRLGGGHRAVHELRAAGGQCEP